MPPEQASGNIDDVDERADVYSLGAILYHILTLRPPIHPGTTEEMLGQVIRGEISSPTKAIKMDPRALTASISAMDVEGAATPSQEHVLSGNLPHLPAGKIPLSLEAIVLKAMARDPAERYASVDEFQKDIAAYRRGFATEAEHASVLKRLGLFIKRNLVVSIASAVVIVLSTAFAFGMAREAERSKQALTRLLKAAPTFVERAWVCLSEGRLEEALEKVSFAVEIDPSNADYHLLRGRLLQSQARLQDAIDSFQQVLQLRKDWVAEENVQVCTRLLSKMKDSGDLPLQAKVELIHAMLRQGRKPDAAALIAELRSSLSENQTLLEKHLSSIPGWEPRRLQATGMGTFVVDLSWLKFDSLENLENLPIVELRLNGCSPSLTPAVLKSISQLPLSSLALRGCFISDLSFLAGTDIESLILSGNNCTHLTPLTSLPLRKLNLRDNPVDDLGPLASCWRLEEIVLPKQSRVVEPLRALASLKRISHRELPNGSPDLTTTDFWKTTQPEEAKDFPQK
jgi:tetratricopeptide (TPR) repeat protein